MLIGRSISSPSKFVILIAPPNMFFLIIKGPDHLGFIFLVGSKVSSISNFRTKSYSLRFLGFTFLLNALVMLFQYPCAWYCALALFSFIKANCSYPFVSSNLPLGPQFLLKLLEIVSPRQQEVLLHYVAYAGLSPRTQKHRQEKFFDIFKHTSSKINPKHVPTPPKTSGFYLNPSIYMAKNTLKWKIREKL